MAAMVIMDLWLAQQTRSSDLCWVLFYWYCSWRAFNQEFSSLNRLIWASPAIIYQTMIGSFTFPVNFSDLEKPGLSHRRVTHLSSRSPSSILIYLIARSKSDSKISTLPSTPILSLSPMRKPSTSSTQWSSLSPNLCNPKASKSWRNLRALLST